MGLGFMIHLWMQSVYPPPFFLLLIIYDQKWNLLLALTLCQKFPTKSSKGDVVTLGRGFLLVGRKLYSIITGSCVAILSVAHSDFAYRNSDSFDDSSLSAHLTSSSAAQCASQTLALLLLFAPRLTAPLCTLLRTFPCSKASLLLNCLYLRTPLHLLWPQTIPWNQGIYLRIILLGLNATLLSCHAMGNGLPLFIDTFHFLLLPLDRSVIAPIARRARHLCGRRAKLAAHNLTLELHSCPRISMVGFPRQ